MKQNFLTSLTHSVPHRFHIFIFIFRSKLCVSQTYQKQTLFVYIFDLFASVLDIIVIKHSMEYVNCYNLTIQININKNLQRPCHTRQIRLRRQHHRPVLQLIRFDKILGQRIQLLQRIRSSRSLVTIVEDVSRKSRALWSKKYSRFLAVTLYGISFLLFMK